MTFTVKTKPGVLPDEVRQQAGFKIGDMLEFKVSGGVVTVLPKLPDADDEYTPEQRAILDAQLDEGLADIKAGRVSRAFKTHGEFIADLHKAGRVSRAFKTHGEFIADLHKAAKKYKSKKVKRSVR